MNETLDVSHQHSECLLLLRHTFNFFCST